MADTPNPGAAPSGGLGDAGAAADAGMGPQPACGSVATCGAAPSPPATPAPTPVAPIITINFHIVLVKKSYMPKSTRMPVVLSTDQAFDGTGTFTSSSGAIRFFSHDSGGVQIESGHSFTGAQLSSSVTIYAEGATPSAKMDDVVLTLALTPGSKPSVVLWVASMPWSADRAWRPSRRRPFPILGDQRL